MKEQRLATILSLVPRGGVVADIGTDHGFVPFRLLKTNWVDKVIATDISLPSLEKSREVLKSFPDSSRYDIRLGNGLQVLRPGEADTVIIAGMGGVLIGEILEACPDVTDKVKKFILQPMQGPEILREYLWTHGYRILKETVTREGRRYYVILSVERGEEEPDDFWIPRGLIESSSSETDGYLRKLIAMDEKTLEKIEGLSGPDICHRREEMKQRIKGCKEGLLWRQRNR